MNRRPGAEWRSPDPTGLAAQNSPRGRMERAAAEDVHRSDVADVAIGRLLLARWFYAWNGDDDTCDVLAVEIEARKREGGPA